jgi:hypothetical protein
MLRKLALRALVIIAVAVGVFLIYLITSMPGKGQPQAWSGAVTCLTARPPHPVSARSE